VRRPFPSGRPPRRSDEEGLFELVMDVSGEELRNPDIRDIPPLSRRSAPEIAELFKDAQQEAVDAATFFRSDFAFDPVRRLPFVRSPG
jgi:hypothetical protein